MAIPNLSDTNSLNFPEGISSLRETLNPTLDEDKVISVIGNRIQDGITFWDSKLDLTRTRENNEKRWLNLNLEVGATNLYDFQTPYRDNRIFVSVETLAAAVVGRLPYPEVTEAQDTEASRELAHQYEKLLFAYAEDNYVRAKLMMVARHLLIGYRIGVMKASWNVNGGIMLPSGKKTGDVAVNWVRPHRLVLDAEAFDPNDVPLIAESQNTTLEELGYMFPEKRDALYHQVAGSEGKVPILQTRLDYHEAWFTFFDNEGNKNEGVAWIYKPIVLGYGLNPNFNYSGGSKTNFFDAPKKPYIIFNFLQLGRWALDDTSLTEQSAGLQDVLEKRGRQIVDNADQASSTRVFNTMQVNAKDAERYVGNPRQNILSKGDARSAFVRIPPPELPSYVLQDKFDARTEIDNIFGTHAPLRGEKTASPTLGQEVMSQRSDLGRVQALSEAIETGSTQLYRHITQLYKVFATETHIRKYLGDDGKAIFTQFSRDKIEDGLEIRVRGGSMRAEDKVSDRNEAIELAKAGSRIDPLTFAEKWHSERPREFAKRLVLYLTDPMRYMKEVLQLDQGSGQEDAKATVQALMAGENVPPKENASKEYIAYFTQFVKSAAFKQLTPEVKALFLQHIQGTIDLTKGGLKEPTKPGFFSGLFNRGGGQQPPAQQPPAPGV